MLKRILLQVVSLLAVAAPVLVSELARARDPTASDGAGRLVAEMSR
jgi:hypothetical protein